MTFVDAVFLGFVIVFFLLSALFVAACSRL